MRPKRSFTSRATRSTWSSWERSAAMATASAASYPGTRRRPCRARPASRATSATRAPSAASPSATARPIPLLPPVTSATLFVNPSSMEISLFYRRENRGNDATATGSPAATRSAATAAACANASRSSSGKPTLVQAAAALDEQRAGAGPVAVGEVLIADRDLDQPLQRLAGLALGGDPVRLEHLVDLEVQARIEEQSSRLQRLAEIGVRRQRRTIGQRPGRATGALPHRGPPLILVRREPAACRGVVCRQRAQLAPRALVAECRDDRARQTLRTRSGSVGNTGATARERAAPAAASSSAARDRHGAPARRAWAPARPASAARAGRPDGPPAGRDGTLDAAAGDQIVQRALVAPEPGHQVARSRGWPATGRRRQIAQERGAEGQQRAVGAHDANADDALADRLPGHLCIVVLYAPAKITVNRRPRWTGRAAPSPAAPESRRPDAPKESCTSMHTTKSSREGDRANPEAGRTRRQQSSMGSYNVTMISVRERPRHILPSSPVRPARGPRRDPRARARARRDVQAPFDVPPADNSAVDGYAVAATTSRASGHARARRGRRPRGRRRVRRHRGPARRCGS